MWVFSDPAKEVGLNKNSWRGVGWEGAAPPPKCIRRTCCVIRLRFVEFCEPCVHIFFVGSQKNILCPSIHMFWCLVFIKVLGPYRFISFWGP